MTMKRISSLIVLPLILVCFSCKKDFQDVNSGQIKVTEEEPLFVKDNDTIYAELLATCEYSGTISQLTVQVGFTEDLVDATSMATTKTDDGYMATFPVQVNTIYYYRYVVHRYSTEFNQVTEWEDEKIHKLSTDDLLLPTVSTVDVSFVSTTSAMGCGLVTNEGGQIIEQGFCWSTHPKPKKSDNYENNAIGEEEMFVQMGGLSSGTTYYTRAYAKSSKGIAYSGNEVCFKTKTSNWKVETLDPTEITDSSATLRIQMKWDVSGSYSGSGIPYGFFFDISPRTNSIIPQTFSGGLGSYESMTKEYDLNNLNHSTTYYFRSFFVPGDIHDTIYGELKSFTTLVYSEILFSSHEVERVFHFTNNDHEYVFDASEYRLHIFRTDSKTGKSEEIANYHIDDIYSQIPGAF